mmetsp:Transcript_15118/g.22297  ORF Transcript_15118/g.22297 Transcript_15118/m.22297 type:complete len:200 (-) Transcript_15118:996-1595(-)
MQIGIVYALVQQLTHAASEFRANFLWFVRDIQIRHSSLRRLVFQALFLQSRLFIGRQQPSEHAHKRRLSRTVLTEQYNNFAIRESTSFNMQYEFGRTTRLRTRHIGVGVALGVLSIQYVNGTFADFERQTIIAESQVFCGDESCQKCVDAQTDGEGHGHYAVRSRGSVQHTHVVAQVVEYRQIVFYDKAVPSGSDVFIL